MRSGKVDVHPAVEKPETHSNLYLILRPIENGREMSFVLVSRIEN